MAAPLASGFAGEAPRGGRSRQLWWGTALEEVRDFLVQEQGRITFFYFKPKKVHLYYHFKVDVNPN